MEYPKSQKYNTPELLSKIMGPYPFKLQEEMLLNHRIPAGSLVRDLGSGQGLTCKRVWLHCLCCRFVE